MSKILLYTLTTLGLATVVPARAAHVANLWVTLPEASDYAGHVRAALDLDEQCSRDLGGTLDKTTIEILTKWSIPTHMLGTCVLPSRER